MNKFNELTKTEEIVYNHLIMGKNNKTIAESLFVGEKTVKFHLTTVYRKLGVNSRAEAIAASIGTHRMRESVTHENPTKGEINKMSFIERLPSKESPSSGNHLSHKSQEDRVKFVNENFGVSKTINQLQSMMIDVIKQEVTPSTVNAACNCVARLNETIDVAIKAARFLNER